MQNVFRKVQFFEILRKVKLKQCCEFLFVKIINKSKITCQQIFMILSYDGEKLVFHLIRLSFKIFKHFVTGTLVCKDLIYKLVMSLSCILMSKSFDKVTGTFTK